MSRLEFWSMFVWYWFKKSITCIIYFLAIPLLLFAMPVAIVALCVYLSYQVMRFFVTVSSPNGVRALKSVLESSNTTYITREVYSDVKLADGFNIDLNRDFVGAAQDRVQGAVLHNVL